MRSGEAAERLGVTPRTIKYYEELGLLQPRRSGGNYRDYDDEDLERVERIRRLQQLGFSLSAIREFVKYRRQVDESGRRRIALADLATAISALEGELTTVRERIARARAEIAQGEQLAEELERDITRSREILQQRQAAEGATAGAGR